MAVVARDIPALSPRLLERFRGCHFRADSEQVVDKNSAQRIPAAPVARRSQLEAKIGHLAKDSDKKQRSYA